MNNIILAPKSTTDDNCMDTVTTVHRPTPTDTTTAPVRSIFTLTKIDENGYTGYSSKSNDAELGDNNDENGYTGYNSSHIIAPHITYTISKTYPPPRTLCLNMIVKNEDKIIERL